MKKLGKLTINPEKVIKNEELMNLKGGYNSGTCAAYCDMDDGGFECNISRSTAESYAKECTALGGVGHWCCDSCSTSDWYDIWCVSGPGY